MKISHEEYIERAVKLQDFLEERERLLKRMKILAKNFKVILHLLDNKIDRELEILHADKEQPC